MYRRIFCLGLAASGCTSYVKPPTEPISTHKGNNTLAPKDSLSHEALPMVNAIRKKNDLPKLVTNLACQNAAQMQADNLAQTGMVRRDIPIMGDAGLYHVRMSLCHVNSPYGENIAKHKGSLDTLFSEWETEPEELVNLLMPDFHRFGMARATSAFAPFSDAEYYSMVFAG